MCRFLKSYALYIAWLLAAVATLVAIYLSWVKGFPVCHLCWYQRICLFPLTLILGIAAYYQDRNIIKYVIPLAGIGFLLGLYQYLIQWLPTWEPINLCGADTVIDCTQIHIQWLGFITLPFLNMCVMFLITFCMFMARCPSR